MAGTSYLGPRTELQGQDGAVVRLGAGMPENWVLVGDGSTLAGVEIADWSYADGGSGVIEADVAGDVRLGDGFNNFRLEITGDVAAVDGIGGDVEVGDAWYGTLIVHGRIEDDLSREWDLFSTTRAFDVGDLKLHGGYGGDAWVANVRKSATLSELGSYEVAIDYLAGPLRMTECLDTAVTIGYAEAGQVRVAGGEGVAISVATDFHATSYRFDAGVIDASLTVRTADLGSTVRSGADGLRATLAGSNADRFVFEGGEAVVDLGGADYADDADRLIVKGAGDVAVFGASAERIVLRAEANVQVFDPGLDLGALDIRNRVDGGRIKAQDFHAQGDAHVAEYGDGGTVTVFGNGVWDGVDDFAFI